MRVSSLSALVFIFASSLIEGCGASKPPPRAATKPAEIPVDHRPDAYDPVVPCPDPVDVAALFAKNSEEFGPEELVSNNSMTLIGTVSVSHKEGTFEQSFDPKRSRHAIHLKGFERASGVDENGAWRLGNSGAVSRLRADETRATDDWILRRHYLSAFDPKRDVAVCTSDGKKAQIIIHEKIAELGSPRLVFDVDTAALVGAEFVGVDGTMSTRSYVWDGGSCLKPRFPMTTTSQDGDGSTIEETFASFDGAKPDAFKLPASILEMTWPKSGNVRVPMKFYGGEILIDVTVGGKKARALLDSGAGISIVEAGGKVADAFTSELEFGGQSATQKLSFGIGELGETHIGALVVKNIPAARVAIPMLDQFGPNRPDVVLGWSLFEGNSVRIDYARNELIFSRDSLSLHKADAPAIDFRVLDDKVIALVKVGERALVPFQLDTGNASSLSIYSGWAKKNQYPAASQQGVAMRGQFSAGTDVTQNAFYRGSYAMGPIVADNDLVEVSDGPATGVVAGLFGNIAFAKCAAVTFDVPNRKLYFDAPCDRKPAQSHAWWTLARNDDAANADHPWVVVSTAAAGTADAAGIAARDRIVAIDGKPAGLTFDFIGTFSKPLGTKVAVTILRGTETKKLSLTLKDPF